MEALLKLILAAINIYWWIVMLAVVFSWLFAFNVINSRNTFVNSVGNALFQLTEPVFRPIRRLLPDLGGVDISPIIVLLLLYFLTEFISTTVARLLL
ncbi:MAG TPA: YggT family protein [Mesorhizobium sp.]|jgi:YggT family protein